MHKPCSIPSARLLLHLITAKSCVILHTLLLQLAPRWAWRWCCGVGPPSSGPSIRTPSPISRACWSSSCPGWSAPSAPVRRLSRQTTCIDIVLRHACVQNQHTAVSALLAPAAAVQANSLRRWLQVPGSDIGNGRHAVGIVAAILFIVIRALILRSPHGYKRAFWVRCCPSAAIPHNIHDPLPRLCTASHNVPRLAGPAVRCTQLTCPDVSDKFCFIVHRRCPSWSWAWSG